MTERDDHLRILYIKLDGRKQEVYSVAPAPQDIRDVAYEVETNGQLVVIDNEDFRRSLDAPDFVVSAIMDHVNVTGKRLEDGTMDRWGFASSSRNDRRDDTNYEIKRIVLADGNDPRFARIGYFASRRSRGGVGTFFEFDFFTLSVQGVPEGVECDQTDPEADELSESFVTMAGSLEIADSPQKEILFRVALDKFCNNNLNKFVNVYAPGNRNRSSLARQLRMNNRPIFCFSPGGQCMRASVVNAVHALAGTEAANQLFRRGTVPAVSLLHLADWLQRIVRLYCMRTPPIAGDPHLWLLEQTVGVFVVRVNGFNDSGRQPRSVDHVVCVDVSSRVVWDPAERFGLHLTNETLSACVGNGCVFNHITEIRELQLQPVRLAKNKKRRNNPEKRKRKRQEKRQALQQPA